MILPDNGLLNQTGWRRGFQKNSTVKESSRALADVSGRQNDQTRQS